jgi:hypothetical protein
MPDPGEDPVCHPPNLKMHGNSNLKMHGNSNLKMHGNSNLKMHGNSNLKVPAFRHSSTDSIQKTKNPFSDSDSDSSSDFLWLPCGAGYYLHHLCRVITDASGLRGSFRQLQVVCVESPICVSSYNRLPLGLSCAPSIFQSQCDVDGRCDDNHDDNYGNAGSTEGVGRESNQMSRSALDFEMKCVFDGGTRFGRNEEDDNDFSDDYVDDSGEFADDECNGSVVAFDVSRAFLIGLSVFSDDSTKPKKSMIGAAGNS